MSTRNQTAKPSRAKRSAPASPASLDDVKGAEDVKKSREQKGYAGTADHQNGNVSNDPQQATPEQLKRLG